MLSVLALAAALDLVADSPAMTTSMVVLAMALFAWLSHDLIAASTQPAPESMPVSNAMQDDSASAFADTSANWRPR